MVSIAYFVTIWMSFYVSFYEIENSDTTSLTMNIFEAPHSYYWHQISLISVSKIISVIRAQYFKNFRYRGGVNAIPLSVRLIPIKYELVTPLLLYIMMIEQLQMFLARLIMIIANMMVIIATITITAARMKIQTKMKFNTTGLATTRSTGNRDGKIELASQEDYPH